MDEHRIAPHVGKPLGIDRLPAERDAPFGRRDQPVEKAQQRRLARPVFPDQDGDLALIDVQ